MGTNTKVGPNQEPAKRFDYVAQIDPATGLPVVGGGSGTSNTTEATQLLVKTAVETTATNQAAVTGSKAAGTAAASSILTGGVFNTSLPTLTNGQQAAAQMDASGRVYVNVGVAALPTGAATETTLGAVKTATEAVQAAVENTDPAPTDEVGNTPFADNAVDESAGATTVLAAPGKLVWLHVYNPHATDVVWLHIFDETTVTLGTTEPVLRIPWKAGSAGWQTLNLDCGLGIKVSAHPTYAKSSTAPAADLVVNLGYRAA